MYTCNTVVIIILGKCHFIVLIDSRIMNEVVIRCFLLWFKSVLETSVGIGLTTGPALGILLYQVSSVDVLLPFVIITIH